MSGPRQCLNVQSHVAQLYLYQQCAVPTLISNSCSLCPLTHGKHEMIGLVLHRVILYKVHNQKQHLARLLVSQTLQQQVHACRSAVNILGRQFSIVVTANLNRRHRCLRLHLISSSDSCRHFPSGTSHILSGTRVGQYQGLKLSVTALYLQQPSHNPAGSNEAGSELICCGTQRVKAQSA